MTPVSLDRKQSTAAGKRQEKIATIMANAADLFQVSFEKTSMRDIGKRVGVDAATIYHYFPSKESILLAVLDQGAEDQLAVIREAASTLDRPSDRLAAAIRSHIIMAVNSPALELQARYFHLFSKEEQSRLMLARGTVDHVFEQLLMDVAADRGKTLEDASLLRNFCFGALNDVRRWYRESGRLAFDEIVHRYIAYIEQLI